MDAIAATELAARSTTLTSVGWIGYIIIGALAGWIAGKIVKGGGSGILMNIVIGIVGCADRRLPAELLPRHRRRRMVVHAVHRDPGIGDPAVDRRDGAAQELAALTLGIRPIDGRMPFASSWGDDRRHVDDRVAGPQPGPMSTRPLERVTVPRAVTRAG